MADILLDEQAAPTTPASGQGVIYAESTASKLVYKDDAGYNWGYHRRVSVADQAPGAADAYITNSGLLIPSFGMQAGMVCFWTIGASKTAASTATAAWTVRIGSAQTTADTSRLVLTMGAQSAVADTGIITVMVTVRNVGAAGVLSGSVAAAGNHAAAVGFGNAVSANSSSYDNSAQQGLFVGLSVNCGASAAWTLTQCVGELLY